MAIKSGVPPPEKKRKSNKNRNSVDNMKKILNYIRSFYISSIYFLLTS